jgi:type II secretory pathway pseudopilin PulG
MSIARCRARGHGEAGFTLMELTVALLAGLIVAMGIVSLSREATNTFHEEARGSAAEAALRTAMDRLRADLARAGYMSTGNILVDPNIAHAPGATNIASITGMAGITGLGSISLSAGGSVGRNPGIKTLSNAQSPALSPDLIQIAGNLTTSEQFDVQSISQSGACRRISLNPNAPALYRILAPSDGGSGAELQNIFIPSAKGAAQFIVRLVDDTGRSQYLATCKGTGHVGLDAANVPYVEIDNTSTPILTANATGTIGGVSGLASGRSWLNPVHIAQWEIIDAATEPAQDSALQRQSLSATDANKYDLMRSYVDATGAVVPDTSEIVAEYAVDLAFAFSVDTGTPALPSITTYGFDDSTSNGPWGVATTTAATGPHRIRSVRARLVTRTAQPDRTVNISPFPANYAKEHYMYRYCLVTPCSTTDGTLRWGRARTLTTDVALVNQSRSY